MIMAATSVVQPLDLIKNRMQLAGRAGGANVTFLGVVAGVAKSEGILAFYNGLSAGLLRQATYTTTRLGVYNTLMEKFASKDGKPPGFLEKALFGVVAGGVGAVIGTPAELALIRMSADGAQPAAERRNYKNVFDALIRVTKEEGVTTLWRGCGPTVARAMVVNAAQLATYSQAKEMLLPLTKLPDHSILLHFYASMVSGFVTTLVSMPVDIIKTRIQNMKVVNGVPEYSGAAHVFSSVVKKEGVFALWKGFFPYYSRIGPHTVLTFIILEQMNEIYAKQMSRH